MTRLIFLSYKKVLKINKKKRKMSRGFKQAVYRSEKYKRPINMKMCSISHH